MGNRLQQTHNGQTTPYTLDLNAGLPQVLSDGTYTYLYGYDRIAQSGVNGMEYFLPDALGSVRQMTDELGGVTLSQSFTPYGELLARGGIGSTSYGYAGEWSDLSGLQNLRARYYAPSTGTFISRDPWSGNVRQPSSLNRYMYVQGNPVNFSDPSGMCRLHDIECRDKSNYIEKTYNIKLETEAAISYKFLEATGIAHDFCVLGFPFDDYYSANPSSYWLTHELESIDAILAIFKDFLSASRWNFDSSIGNGRTIIKKVIRTSDGNTVPVTNTSWYQLPLGYRGPISSTILLPLDNLGNGSIGQFGATFSHELMHVYNYSFNLFGLTYTELTSSFWNNSTRINVFFFRVPCGGPSLYSCQQFNGKNTIAESAGEDFAESAAVYALDWARSKGSTDDIRGNAITILNNYTDPLNPNKPLVQPPSKWQDMGLRQNMLFNLFGR